MKRSVDSAINTEHSEQVTLIEWWDMAANIFHTPKELLFAIPNGGKRSPVTGSILKAEGVRRGIPDLMLAIPRGNYHGLFNIPGGWGGIRTPVTLR